MLQNATRFRKSAPWPPDISDRDVFCTYCACQAKCIFAGPLQTAHAWHRFCNCYKTLTFASLLARRRGAESTAPATRDHIQTSKSGPRPSVFNTFDFQMCFKPQRHAIADLSCRQMAPHPPLSRAYFSTLRSPKTLEEHSVAWLFYLFLRFNLLFRSLSSADSFSSLTSSLLTLSLLWLFPSLLLHLSILSEFWLLNVLQF